MTTTDSEVFEAYSSIEEVYDSSSEIKSWDDLDLDSKLLRGIFSYGFENRHL